MFVLSIFPGLDTLGAGFEAIGACVVRGPDLLWGGDVHRFHPPMWTFDGVVGGPPCQRWSRLANLVRAVHGEDKLAPDLIPEYERVCREAQPRWWLMENVPGAPEPYVPGYQTRSLLLDNRDVDRGDGVGPEQRRVRRWSFGTRDGRALDLAPYLAKQQNPKELPSVTASGSTWIPKNRGGSGSVKATARMGRIYRRHTRTYLEDAQRAQGFPEDFSITPPFTVRAAIRAVGNAVPRWMAEAVAKAVRDATE